MTSNLAGIRGFSIIELLLVLALLAVLSATAIWAVAPSRARFNLWIATSQVVSDLNLTRIRAIAANVDQRLHFPPNSDSYQAQYLRGASVEPLGGPISLPSGVIIKSCSARDSAVQFRPRGHASSFGTIVLESGDVSRRVIVNIAGHIRVG